MTGSESFPYRCPVDKCAGFDEGHVCNVCGVGVRLSPIPDYEAGRLFDEWWATKTEQEIFDLDRRGELQQSFDMWRSQRETKQ